MTTFILIYQIYRTGTGNAAEQAGHFLSDHQFDGNILVVPGDKVIELAALERLTAAFHEQNADLALMVADKGIWPDAGRIVLDGQNNPADIVEKRDVQKLILAGKLRGMASKRTLMSSSDLLDLLLSEVPSRSKAGKMFPQLMQRIDTGIPIDGSELVSLVPDEFIQYRLQTESDDITMSGDELETACIYTNSSVYLFSARAFYRTVFSLETNNAQQEQYFTDTIRMLHLDAERKWTVIPVVAQNREEVMAFNTPEELAEIDHYYRTKEESEKSVGA